MLGFIMLSVSIAVAGYFIGDGLKNFKNPNTKGLLERLEEDDSYDLINEKYIHTYLGLSKEDGKSLIKEYPDIPHLVLNGTVYYPRPQLRKWLADVGKKTN